jgi:hypothetical protein
MTVTPSSETSLRLIIEWPNGTHLPVRLPSAATGADLFDLLRFCVPDDGLFALVANGICIDPRRELRRQHIPPNSIVQLFRVTNDSSRDEDDLEPPSECINSEILRLSDVQMAAIEGNPRCGQLMRQIIADSEPEEPIVKGEVTVCPPAPVTVSEDPLPVLPLMGEAAREGGVWEDGDCDARLAGPGPVRSGWNW